MKKILLLSLLLFVVPVVGMYRNRELLESLSERAVNGFAANVDVNQYNELRENFNVPRTASERARSSLSMDDSFLAFSANGKIGQRPTRGALLSACTKGDFELVKKLVDGGAGLEAKDYSGAIALEATPLMRACSNGNIDIVKYLIKNGAQLDAKDKSGEICLHYACRAKRCDSCLDLIKHLIKCGVNINVKSGGENILHEICRTFFFHTGNGREQVTEYIKYFVEGGVDFYEKNNYEITPYDCLTTKDKHLLREKFDCKLVNNILLMGLGHTFDKGSMLSALPNDVMNEIRNNSVEICLSSAQAQIWKPVCKKAHELNNELYCVHQYDVSSETLNIVRILTWPKEKRVAISGELMKIENSAKEINKKDFYGSQWGFVR